MTVPLDPIVIVGSARTPMGSFQGALAGQTASELGGAVIGAALDRAGVARSQVDEVIMGCVLPAGQGQAPARQAGFHAGLSESVPATTVNKMCGSGMKAVMLAMDQLLSGHAQVVVAGGMESMSNAPYLLPKMRDGARMGSTIAQDHMFLDGLQDAYEEGRLMGSFAEDCAEKYQLTRRAQDDYALTSLARAQAAQQVAQRVAKELLEHHQQPRRVGHVLGGALLGRGGQLAQLGHHRRGLLVHRRRALDHDARRERACSGG